MKKASIFIIIFLIVALPLAVFTYCLRSTRVIPNNVIELVIKQSKNGLALDNESLLQLKEIINKQSVLEDQNKISEIFEKERSKYIELLTIVSIILTVFSLFSIATGFIEKNENAKFKEDFVALKNAYNVELSSIKWNSLIASINEMIQRTNQLANFIFLDNGRVDTLEKYEKFLTLSLSNFIKSAQSEQFKQAYNLQSFSIAMYNYLLASKNYSLIKYGNPVSSINFTTDSISKIFIHQIVSNIPNDVYLKIKEHFIDLSANTIIWGAY